MSEEKKYCEKETNNPIVNINHISENNKNEETKDNEKNS